MQMINGNSPNNTREEVLRAIKVGDVIAYRLQREWYPTDATKIWRGEVKLNSWGVAGVLPGCTIRSLESGYEGLEEFVPVQAMIFYCQAKDKEWLMAAPFIRFIP